jgi:bacillithiol biosynthesis deacetylase BshB1
MEKLNLLCFAAHPDDTELACSGTILHHIHLGYKVGLVDLTQGELGTRGSAELRAVEAANSAKILGISVRDNLGLADGFFQKNRDSLIKVIEKIRQYQPEIILCNAVSDRHPDHGRAAKLTTDACFYAGLMKIETKDNNTVQAAWRPKAVYHYIQDNFIEPDFVIDITDFMDKKTEAIMAYSSQFFNPLSVEPETPISSKNFTRNIKAKASIFGRAINCDYAEGFKVNRYIGVENLFDLK